MSARNMLRDLIANTADDYLDAHYGRDRDNDAVVELILGARLREAAGLLETLGMDDAAAQLRYQATPYTDDSAPTTTTGAGGQR